ncbi:MAG: hypothetical protein AAB074_06625 [Planctomycetota bacterium]
MPRSHLIAYLVIAVAAGFLGGVLFEHGRKPLPPTPEGKGGEATASPLVQSGMVPPPSVGPQASADKAIAEKRWGDAAAEIRAVIASGEQNWDEALSLIFRVLAVDDIVEYTLREDALEPLAADITFHKHSVPTARALRTFEAELYLEQAFAWLAEAHEGKFLFEALEGADAEELPRILRALEGNVTKEILPELAKMTREAQGLALQMQYLKLIVSLGPEAEPALKDLAKSPERLLAEAAAAALQMVKPPATGFLVQQVPGREERPNGAGKRLMANPVHRGDIVTQVGDVKIDSEAAWGRATARFAGRAMVEVKLVRKGEAMTVQYPTPLGAPKGKFVVAVK